MYSTYPDVHQDHTYHTKPLARPSSLCQMHMLSLHHHFFCINIKLSILCTDPVYVYVIMQIILIHPSPMYLCISTDLFLYVYLNCPSVYTIKSSNKHMGPFDQGTQRAVPHYTRGNSVQSNFSNNAFITLSDPALYQAHGYRDTENKNAYCLNVT